MARPPLTDAERTAKSTYVMRSHLYDGDSVETAVAPGDYGGYLQAKSHRGKVRLALTQRGLDHPEFSAGWR